MFCCWVSKVLIKSEQQQQQQPQQRQTHPKKMKLKWKLSIGINTSLSLSAASKSQRKTPPVMSSNRIRPEYALLMLLATLIPMQLAAPVTDSDPDGDSDSNWDPAETTISPYTYTYTEDSTVPQAETEVDGQRIDCKLTFDAATMESLGCHNKARAASASMGAELGPGPGPDSAANKPEDIAQDPEVLPLQMQRHLKRPDSQPIYELQLVVWPSDIEDGDDFSPPLATTTTTSTTTQPPPTTTTAGSTTTTIGTPIEQIWPLYEDQLVVFPQMDFEEENLDYFFDDVGPSSTTTSPPSTTGSSTTWHPTGTPTPTPIYVVQNYHVIHPNGTEEYK